ncbi:hypothetical protein FK178_05265 [Antarcticibacterium arcticum]|uniref:Secreted protein n=1 Tax=Antarcticibacterium arcticum TaxID=2585771 RepID=A0A5B8YHA0_9FLAO|nr:hypothetical protein [Antarcticibacterium arcticum]QED37154.1 hypothetical protein FK178_05265 [Antarcticibacterium arcticum]
MKSILYKISSSLLASLVFLSTMSFTVNKHFCGDFLVDQAIFSQAETCGMEHDSGISDEKGCSEDSVAIDGQKDLKISFYDLNFDQQVFLASFTYSLTGLFEEQPAHNVPFANYIPPLLVYDIQVLDQTFLI